MAGENEGAENTGAAAGAAAQEDANVNAPVSGDESVDFNDLLSEPSEDEDSGAAAGTQEGAKPVETPAPQAAPAQPSTTPQTPAASASPQEQQQAPAAAAATPQTPPAQQQAQQPTQAQPAPQQQQQQQQEPAPVDLAALRQKTVDEIASTYTFTDDEKRLLQEEPEKVLPRLAAQVTVQAYEAVSRTVMAHLPALVATINQATKQQNEVENKFFTAFPRLQKPEFRETLGRVGATFRQLNPNASVEDAIRHIGLQTALMLGVQDPHLPEGQMAPAAQTAGATPAAQPQASATAQPHTPAAPGAVAAARAASPGNMWADMAREFEELNNDG